MARLSRLVGPGRALEILVGADDFTGELAERYGYVNRAVPDAEFDTFIDRFARRVAGFEKEAIVGTKAFVNEATLPPVSELAPNMDAFFASVARPEVQARAIALFQKGLQTRCERPTVGCGAVRMRLFFLVRTAGIVLGETIDGIRLANPSWSGTPRFA